MLHYRTMQAAVKTHRKYEATFRKQQAQATRNRILEASRRLLAKGTYSTLTMADIAVEAGVAYQTVYAIFGTKVRLANALVEAGFSHIPDALTLFDRMFDSPEPEQWFRTASHATRLILEPCADLARFIRESGDPVLLSGYQQREEMRYNAIAKSGFVERLATSGRLSHHLSPSEAVAVIWAMSGADLYNPLVFGRRWSPARYEEWLADALMKAVLKPATQPTTTVATA
jgi:TetR/AcrR family transcriptional regulator, regulator of autoinduction and epiphytic fitness